MIRITYVMISHCVCVPSPFATGELMVRCSTVVHSYRGILDKRDSSPKTDGYRINDDDQMKRDTTIQD